MRCVSSGGGIVAFAIGLKRLSVQDAIDIFGIFSKKAFTKRKGSGAGFVIETMVMAHHHSKYETKPMNEALRGIFNDDILFGGHISEANCNHPQIYRNGRCINTPLKVGVTSTTTTSSKNEAYLLSNYHRPQCKSNKCGSRGGLLISNLTNSKQCLGSPKSSIYLPA